MVDESYPVTWEAEWIVDVGNDCVLGIGQDDGCFIVLYPREEGGWSVGTHIPPEVARKLGEVSAELQAKPLND